MGEELVTEPTEKNIHIGKQYVNSKKLITYSYKYMIFNPSY